MSLPRASRSRCGRATARGASCGGAARTVFWAAGNATLLPFLRRHLDIDIYIDDGYEVSDAGSLGVTHRLGYP